MAGCQDSCCFAAVLCKDCREISAYFSKSSEQTSELDRLPYSGIGDIFVI